MKSKKNLLFNFCFSFIPGCAEMYMGFMKMGLSLMMVFWGVLIVASFFNLSPIVYFSIVIWFYSFFHARNMVHMPDESLKNLEDRFLLPDEMIQPFKQLLTKKYRNVVAYFLILYGGFICFSIALESIKWILPKFLFHILDTLVERFPPLLVGIAIIALGYHLIDGKKMALLEEFSSFSEAKPSVPNKKEPSNNKAAEKTSIPDLDKSFQPDQKKEAAIPDSDESFQPVQKKEAAIPDSDESFQPDQKKEAAISDSDEKQLITNMEKALNHGTGVN